LQALRDALKALNVAILRHEEQLVAGTRDAAQLAEYLSGMDAIRLLDSRAEEFAALAAQADSLKQAVAEAGESLAAAQAERDAAEQRYSDARIAHDRVCQREQESLQREHKARADMEQARRALRRHLAELRDCRNHLPAAAQDAAFVAQLADEFESAADVRHEINYLEERLAAGDWERDDAVLQLKDKLQEDLTSLTRECQRRQAEVERAAGLTSDAREAYLGKLRATVRAYGHNVKRLGELAGIGVEVELPTLSNDDAVLAQAGLVLKFNFDQKGLMGLNDGEASGGQQVMKSLIMLIGLMMDEANPSGFVFIDEPFAHLDIFNIDRVAGFLKATEAQYLITTPNTHNINIFAPSGLTLATRKKRPGEQWAPAILQTRRKQPQAE
jgi:chromosome segregation ATPase